MAKVNLVDFAWLVGLLEGEGCFTLNGSWNNKQPCILLQMTDKDIVDKASRILGGNGFVFGRERKGDTYGKKIMYRYAISSTLAIFWMKSLLPHMGERRQKQIKYIIEYWESSPRRKSNVVLPIIEGVA